MYWLATITFLLHCVEEFPSFPEWATRHFGVTSRPYYVYSHIPLIIGVIATSYLGSTGGTHSVWPMIAMAAQWILFTNGLFHLVTTLLFREYSPGVITGSVLFVPSTIYVMQHSTLRLHDMVVAIGLGTIAGGAVIGSLWLNMDWNWRLGRRAYR